MKAPQTNSMKRPTMLCACFTVALSACAGSALSACAGSAPSSETPGDPSSAESSSPAGNENETAPSAASAAADSSGDSADDTGPDAQNEGVPSKRSMDSIVEVITNNRHLFRLCYEEVQKEKPELKGDVVIHFRITSKGEVVSSQVNPEGTTLSDENVGACAAEEMKKLTFPEVETGMDTEINYPFNFNPR